MIAATSPAGTAYITPVTLTLPLRCMQPQRASRPYLRLIIERSRSSGLSHHHWRRAPAAGGVTRVRALKDIKAGAELTVQYVNLMEPRAERQRLLAERYFTCACERCSEPLATSTDRLSEARPMIHSRSGCPTECQAALASPTARRSWLCTLTWVALHVCAGTHLSSEEVRRHRGPDSSGCGASPAHCDTNSRWLRGRSRGGSRGRGSSTARSASRGGGRGDSGTCG